MNVELDLPDEVARTVAALPDPPLSGRNLRDIGPGPAGVVAVPVSEASEESARVRLYFPDVDVLAAFADDAGEWVVEAVESPDGAG